MASKKPARRSPKKTAEKKQVVVGVKMTKPTAKQLAALKEAFGATALASAGIGPTAGITKQNFVKRRRRPS